MTCIVGIAQGGVVHIGGDSAATHGTVPKLVAAGKVWRTGEFIMGGSGSSRVNDLIRYNFRPPKIRFEGSRPESVDRYMNSAFASSLRKLFEEQSCIGKDEETQQEDFGGSLLIGVRGSLYLMDCSFSAYRTVDEFNATGSGHEVALGALHALAAAGAALTPRERLKIALEAAERWQDGIRAPFTFESTRVRRAKR